MKTKVYTLYETHKVGILYDTHCMTHKIKQVNPSSDTTPSTDDAYSTFPCKFVALFIY